MVDWAPAGPGSTPEREPPTTLERVLAANRRYASGGAQKGLAKEPARKLVVVTCMDARIDPLRTLGLKLGDAHVIRVPGAAAGEEVLRAIALSRSATGSADVLLVAHTDCAARDSDLDAETSARRDAERIRAAQPDMTVHALVYDVQTALLRQLD
jgi:carbonic anhydrase